MTPEQQQEIIALRDRKPFYTSGPYDNPLKLIKTLRENVGEGNFDYILEMG